MPQISHLLLDLGIVSTASSTLHGYQLLLLLEDHHLLLHHVDLHLNCVWIHRVHIHRRSALILTCIDRLKSWILARIGDFLYAWVQVFAAKLCEETLSVLSPIRVAIPLVHLAQSIVET